MTEHEAKALAKRLKRIWEPSMKHPGWSYTNGQFSLAGMLTRDVSISYQQNRDARICIELNNDKTDAGLIWDDDEGTFDIVDTTPDGTFGQLIAESWGLTATSAIDQGARPEDLQCHEREWLEFFRRGCWLSGCPIEASAHEKAEWIQGFSQEEIEAWDLKM